MDKMPPKRTSNLENDKSKKRSRQSVSLDTKLKVLRRLEAGEKIVNICKTLLLAKSTVQTIRNNREKIKAHSKSASALSVSKLTRKRSNIMETMEKLLSIWIEDNNKRRIPMTQMIIQEKAKSIFDNLKSKEISEDVTFLASRGWFEKFKNRHNFQIKMKEEAASADVNAAQEFSITLKNIIENGGYLPEQVFNVSETGLFWKRMPERTYLSKNEKSALDKVSKERLTLLLGANAAGDFRLKPLLVYVSKNPRSFKGLNKEKLPVIWRSNKKAWMTKILFEEWFKNHFCPEVKLYLHGKNLSNKVLLLLDNAPGHPVNLSELSEDVQIVYLPKNITPLIQPMDQGAIATFKAYYMQRIFCKLVKETDSESSIKQFWNIYNIEDAVNNISESWKELKSTILNNVWRKIWPECITTNDTGNESLPDIRQNILNLANDLGFVDLDVGDVVNLLDADREPFSDEELIQLETYQTLDEDPKQPECLKLMTKDLIRALTHFEQGISILLNADPDKERSIKVAQMINTAVNCYKELQKEENGSKQLMLKYFIQPQPSSTEVCEKEAYSEKPLLLNKLIKLEPSSAEVYEKEESGTKQLIFNNIIKLEPSTPEVYDQTMSLCQSSYSDSD